MPGITEDIFVESMKADFQEIQTKGKELKNILSSDAEVRITCPIGTDFKFSISTKQYIKINDGSNLNRKGHFENILAGEIFLAPIETSGNGTVIFSYSEIVEKSARLEVKEGVIIDSDLNAKPLVELLEKYEGGTTLAEFGIGINKKARLIKLKVIESEKVWGTVHVAFGQNKSFGRNNYLKIHHDLIIVSPSVWVGKNKIVDDGIFL